MSLYDPGAPIGETFRRSFEERGEKAGCFSVHRGLYRAGILGKPGQRWGTIGWDF